MFEEILNEIKEVEAQCESRIDKTKRSRHEKIKEIVESYEKDLSEMINFEKNLQNKRFEEEKQAGEKESDSIQSEFNSEISKIKEKSGENFNQALNTLLEGMY